jgi:REP element-mobilizing transposase RayT
MAHTFTHLLVHVIFSTKDRQPFLDADVGPRVFAYMGGILKEQACKPVLINGPADHVHALTTVPPTTALSDVMRVLKTNSSRWVHEQFPRLGSFAWQTGYGAFGVSRSNADEVERYVANQQEHHRHVTFQEEFLAFLQRHGVAYDPRYIWE